MRLPHTIASSIDQIARSALGKDWGLYASLIDHWAEIVGEEYAKHTSPVKITFPKGKKADEKWASGQRTGGILTVKLPQGLSMAFSHQTGIVINRINGFFGYPVIGKIALAPAYMAGDAPLPQQTLPPTQEEKAGLDSALVSIENNDLKDALAQLGTSVLANRDRV